MPKVLIIEDRRENIVFIANNILKPKGFDVVTARDGQTGLKKAQKESPDLIITDLKLPKIGGLEVLEQLCKKGIFIPTIVMTFHGTEETAMRALRLGASDYLIKPFTIEEMEDALNRALNPQGVGVEARHHKLDSEGKIAMLEGELDQLKLELTQKETLLEDQLQQKPDNDVAKMNMKEDTEWTVWEKDNARLNELLAESKDAESKAKSRANALEEAVIAQKAQTLKYQKEASQLAKKLRNLSEAIRLMSQDMEQQMGRLVVLTPNESE